VFRVSVQGSQMCAVLMVDLGTIFQFTPSDLDILRRLYGSYPCRHVSIPTSVSDVQETFTEQHQKRHSRVQRRCAKPDVSVDCRTTWRPMHGSVDARKTLDARRRRLVEMKAWRFSR
jgi:hypothetical protein